MAATAPLVSILIPAYHARHFAEAFESARAQDYPALEILVCDDSADAAIEDCVAAARDARVRYSRNPARLGFEANFTHCLDLARGTLVKFLNDDDRLRADCVAQLAGAFGTHPGIRLATSRRRVVDALGAPRPDIPATSPVSYVSCVMDGIELGDVALLNGLNLVGEPSTVMFRREDLARDGRGIFTWGATSFHCLADLSLWLRLLARGSAYYCAHALSDYRVHAGQEQRTLGIDCITERFHLVVEARRVGFLRKAAQARVALARVTALAEQWSTHPALDPAQRERLATLTRDVAEDVAALADA